MGKADLTVCVCLCEDGQRCVCVCVHVHEYNTVIDRGVAYSSSVCVQACVNITDASLHQKKHVCLQADICIFLPICVMGAYACVILTWWPVRWRRAVFPAGHAGSLRSSSGVGASRRHSCHSSGTCRRRGRLSASERQTAGPPSHTLGSLPRSRWPGVSGGGMKGKMRWRTRKKLFGEQNGGCSGEKAGSKVKTDETTRGEKMGWGCWEKIGLDQERRADELGREGENKG